MEHNEIFNRMSRLATIRELKADLSREETELSVPLLHDLCMVGNVYDLFTAIIGKQIKRRDVSMERKMFIFVILYFFSPASLVGFRMRRGLRGQIADVLGCTCSNVSHDYKDVGFYYNTYKKFRSDCYNVISTLRERLGV